MYKKTITYVDYNGEERTEDFYFNISKAELFDLEFSGQGGFAEYAQRIVDAKDRPALVKAFKEILEMSYGEKDPSGRRFIKSPELTKAFMETEAYSNFYVELATDTELAAEFIKGVLPSDLGEATDKVIANLSE